jgi:hypothetical protein
MRDRFDCIRLHVFWMLNCGSFSRLTVGESKVAEWIVLRPRAKTSVVLLGLGQSVGTWRVAGRTNARE